MRALYGFIGLVVLLTLVTTSSGQENTLSSGQLAISGGDGNIYLYDVATETTTQLTDDADEQKTYFWPTWATDGQLAYFGTSNNPDDVFGLGVYIHQDPLTNDSASSFISPGDSFTYAGWAPADCADGGCRDLALLYTPPSGGLAARMLRSTENGIEIRPLAEGGPFYWDWSPDGQSMFWARFGENLEIYDIASEMVTQTFDEIQGPQRSIDWSPVDNRLLSAVRNDRGLSDLILFDGDDRTLLLEDIRGLISFEWSPDGHQIGYLLGNNGQLGIVDDNGTESLLPVDQVVAFFWSPDSSKIAYLTVGVARPDVSAKPVSQQIAVLVWHVYDVANDSSDTVAVFRPTNQMIYYFSFFDQFARSHRLWSPDSRYLVYADQLPGGKEVVSIVDVNTAQPLVIMEGDLGIFSWH